MINEISKMINEIEEVENITDGEDVFLEKLKKTILRSEATAQQIIMLKTIHGRYYEKR